MLLYPYFFAVLVLVLVRDLRRRHRMLEAPRPPAQAPSTAAACPGSQSVSGRESVRAGVCVCDGSARFFNNLFDPFGEIIPNRKVERDTFT